MKVEIKILRETYESIPGVHPTCHHSHRFHRTPEIIGGNEEILRKNLLCYSLEKLLTDPQFKLDHEKNKEQVFSVLELMAKHPRVSQALIKLA